MIESEALDNFFGFLPHSVHYFRGRKGFFKNFFGAELKQLPVIRIPRAAVHKATAYGRIDAPQLLEKPRSGGTGRKANLGQNQRNILAVGPIGFECVAPIGGGPPAKAAPLEKLD